MIPGWVSKHQQGENTSNRRESKVSMAEPSAVLDGLQHQGKTVGTEASVTTRNLSEESEFPRNIRLEDEESAEIELKYFRR